MKPPQDPPRLLDPGSDAPAWLRGPLEAGARDVAGPERLARIAARLPSGPTGHGGGDPRPPTTPATPAGVPPLPSMFSGAAVGAALGLAVVGAGWLTSPRAAPEPPPALQASSATVTPAPPEPLRLGPTETPARRPRFASGRPEPLPSGSADPAASVGSGPAVSAASGAAAAGREPSTAEPNPLVAESENAILQRAQDALRGSPAQALALTDLHLARYPGGTLAQEREVIAVSALLGMGRAAEARARAARFVASFPTSAHRRRLDVLIPDLESSAGVHKDPGDPPSTP